VKPWARISPRVMWTALVLVAIGWVVWRVSHVRQTAFSEVESVLEISLTTSRSETGAWGGAQRDRVAMAAQLAKGRDLSAFDARQDLLALLDAMVDGLHKKGVAAVAAATDENGGILAAESDGATAPQPAAWSFPGNRDLTGNVRCGTQICVAMREPTSFGTQAGWIVLWIPVTDDTFRGLNPAARSNNTGRTSVVARIGDSVAVLASRSNSAKPVPRMLPWSRVPQHVRTALGGSGSSGHGPGLFGVEVIYAASPVSGMPWAVVREMESAEILHDVNVALIVEESLVVALLFSLAFLLQNRVRAVQARRTTELTQLRADFVSSVSHELRTPLAQIRMFAELLRKGSMRTPQDADRALRIIEKEASRLTILVDNILNYTRLRKRAERASSIPTHVTGAVRQTIESFAPLSAERGVQIEAEIEPDLWATVDSLGLRQVLLNFLENAVKYGPRDQTVTVGAKALDGIVRVWVDDQGPGVPPSERDAVWRAFYRRKESIAAGATGAGIGLAVVRELVLQSGGSVQVTDAPNGGARFLADLPRAETPENPDELMVTGERPVPARAG
jgi:signal transduction histidine kinase